MIVARGVAYGVACGLAFSAPAFAAAAEECLSAGDAPAVLKCLTDELGLTAQPLPGSTAAAKTCSQARPRPSRRG
jgi:hypothetical protein